MERHTWSAAKKKAHAADESIFKTAAGKGASTGSLGAAAVFVTVAAGGEAPLSAKEYMPAPRTRAYIPGAVNYILEPCSSK